MARPPENRLEELVSLPPDGYYLAFSIRAGVRNDVNDLNQFIQTADFLPPAFQLLPRLLLLLDDPEVNSEGLADIIRVDPGLSADVLRVSNSAARAGDYPVETLQDAVVRLGMREVYRITMKVIASPVLLTPGPPSLPSGADLWTHSLGTAIAAESIGLEKYADPEVAFTSGLLHDLGKTFFAERFKAEYGQLLERSRDERVPCFEAERLSYGVDHASLGAKLLERWNFPERILAAVQFHHDPAGGGEHARLAAIVYTANIIAHRVGLGFDFPGYVISPEPACLAMANLKLEDLPELEVRALEKFRQEQAIFR